MTVTRRTCLSTALAGAVLFVSVPLAFAGKVNVDAEGIGIKGYDPVAYFTDAMPVMGSGEFTSTHGGVTYRFASAAHREAFAADPAKYAPQYGGFCAYAVAHGATAPIDPQAFTVVDDKLYLNYSLYVRDEWRNDIPGFIKKANTNWPRLLGM